MARRNTKKFLGSGIPVSDRPWYALTQGQRELRLDLFNVWHERELWAEELLEHPAKRVRQHAENASAADMLLLMRALKMGIDLAAVSMERLRATDLSQLKKLPFGNEPDAPLSAPALVGTFPDLEKTLNALILKTAGSAPSPRLERSAVQQTADESRFDKPTDTQTSDEGSGMEGFRRADEHAAASGLGIGAIPESEEEEVAATAAADEAIAAAHVADRKEIDLIRSKLAANGKPRLDVEALAVYMMCPSYFAIATGLDPEPWQSKFLDSYALRLGCLASRQCGKSIITARKATCFATTNPATTTLILAPTLRQSSELLLKISGTVQIAGLKIASLSQFQLVLADKQPGAMSRIVCLPGSNEDSGASTRGYAADLLILEEAAFLSDVVISSVLPSIAARPKAQLIGISSAGIIGSYFHTVMTSPQSRWVKMIVPASRSGRFSAQQLEELRLTLGARYPVEMECQWGSIGDSIYTAEVMDRAFGTDSSDPLPEPIPDPDAAFAHLDMEAIFTARPFERTVA